MSGSAPAPTGADFPWVPVPVSGIRHAHLLPAHEPETLGIHAVYLSRQHQPLPLKLLVEFLAERFGGDVAPWDLPP